MASFLYPGGAWAPSLPSLPGFAGALYSMTREELAATCREALAHKEEEPVKKVLEYLLSRWITLDPKESLAFVLTSYPEGLSLYRALEPQAAGMAFINATGQTPVQSVLDPSGPVPPPWDALAEFMAQEEWITLTPQQREKALELNLSKLQTAAAGLRSTVAAERDAALKEGQAVYAALLKTGARSPSSVVALGRFFAARPEDLGPLNPAEGTGPVLRSLSSLSLGLADTWPLNQTGIITQLQAMPDTGERDAVIDTMASMEPGKAAAELVRACRSDWGNCGALIQALGEWAQTDTAGAAAFAANIPAGPAGDACRLAVAETWAASDPAGALHLAMSAAPSAGRDASVRQIFLDWQYFQPQAAGEWLGSQSPDDASVLSKPAEK